MIQKHKYGSVQQEVWNLLFGEVFCGFSVTKKYLIFWFARYLHSVDFHFKWPSVPCCAFLSSVPTFSARFCCFGNFTRINSVVFVFGQLISWCPSLSQFRFYAKRSFSPVRCHYLFWSKVNSGSWHIAFKLRVNLRLLSVSHCAIFWQFMQSALTSHRCYGILFIIGTLKFLRTVLKLN